MTFSLLAQELLRRQGQKFNSGSPSTDSAPRAPALPGFVRGTLGVLGARPVATRNVDAGENRERMALEKQRVKLPYTSRRIRALQQAGRF